ncbi:Monooxygenase FAD-binding protein [Macrophomina phaseolina MS6]|uniref:Monooxygenase FAD-binding protein n=1 Tax=Macrophomina phaseolina (strain MS6) TaxID=1126212 RepID=K2R617_MACPH|nr:Monooxygenase FAD-binding protein [Macrophomina phaseolina MS6]
MPPSQPRIAIVGGGPAGLTLGLLLHTHNIPFTVFELRKRPSEADFAALSGSLDLHEESGLAALRACRLFDEALALTGDCTQQQRIAAKNGDIIFDFDGGLGRPEIYRHDLMKLLVSRLPADSVQWGHKLLRAERNETGSSTSVELDFGAHGRHDFDLVVGTDGAWSRVRPLLTDLRPHYAGFQTITLHIRHVTAKHPHLAALMRRGTFYGLADRHGVLAQRAAQDSARIYIMISTGDSDYAAAKGLAGKTPGQAKDVLVGAGGILSQWGDIVKELVAVACDDEARHNGGAALDINALHTLPVGHGWEHRPDATLIGDAAHLLNPPAGEGVNIAMQDALLLAQAIVQAHEAAEKNHGTLEEALDAAIRQFEADMLPRAMEMAEGTNEVSQMMFGSEDGSTAMADWFRKMGIV